MIKFEEKRATGESYNSLPGPHKRPQLKYTPNLKKPRWFNGESSIILVVEQASLSLVLHITYTILEIHYFPAGDPQYNDPAEPKYGELLYSVYPWKSSAVQRRPHPLKMVIQSSHNILYMYYRNHPLVDEKLYDSSSQ